MTPEERAKHVHEAKASLARVQDFDATAIARVEDLGRELNFTEGVEPLRRTLNLFKEISADVLADMSTQRRDTTKSHADALFNLLAQILAFSTAQPSAKETRDALLTQLRDGYDSYFNELWPSIAYSVRRATDFSRMEREARAAIQAIEDRTRAFEATLAARVEESTAAIEAIRKVAAEQGVSQQALYFKDEAKIHADEAEKWLKASRNLTIGLGFYATTTLFLHKVPWLKPESAAEAIQFGIGKMLVFATIAYFLLLAARNYMAHRHNAIVNKHRQNSLVTYRALVEAAGDKANRDIILAKAADSIFGAQTTGFTQHDGDDSKAMPLVNIGAGAFKSSGGGS